MVASAQAPPSTLEAKLSRKPGRLGVAIFALALIIGCAYAAFHLISDLSKVRSTSIYPYLLLGAALLIELAHPCRIHHWRGNRQSAHVGQNRDQRRGLGAGGEHREIARHLAHRRIPLRRAASDHLQETDPRQTALPIARWDRAAAFMD